MSAPRTPGDDAPAKQIALGVTVALFAAAVCCRLGRQDAPARVADEAATSAAFAPPPASAIPAGPDGDAIRRGRALFLHMVAHAGRFVGNGLACRNCHLDAGRQADAAPMWAAWVSYPALRAKNGSRRDRRRRRREGGMMERHADYALVDSSPCC